mgnify:CR=1 FL=1
MSLSLNFTRSQNRRDASNFYLLLIPILLLLSIHANAAAKSVECSVPKEFKLAPPKVEGYPVKISVGLYLLDIVEIDEIRPVLDKLYKDLTKDKNNKNITPAVLYADKRLKDIVLEQHSQLLFLTESLSLTIKKNNILEMG